MKIHETLAETEAGSAIFEFGDFVIDHVHLRRRDGTSVPLTSKVFETLRFLVEHPGTVLDKERIMEAVWPDSIVEENNLAQAISKLRHVFGEKPGESAYIATVPGRGYRFVADVRRRSDSAAEQVRSKTVSSAPTAPRNGRLVSISALITLLFLICAAGLFFWWRQSMQQSNTQLLPDRSIAVLPFENLSEDKGNAWFAAGVEEEILTRLAKLSDLKVISRTSMRSFSEKKARDLPQMALQLGVANFLEGSVQRAGNRVRIHAQLIDARTGAHIWAESYDRDVTDVFRIQSEIATTIAQQLHAKIAKSEKAALDKPATTDLVAETLYAQAAELEFDYPNRESLLAAVRLLEQAVARDPNFLLAYCALARLQLDLFNSSDHNSARRELANAAIQRAVQLQPDAGEVHRALALYAYWGFLDYDHARAELDIARRTLPNDAELCAISGLIDRRQGRWIEATRNLERAVELDPRNERFLLFAGGTHEVLRRYSEASRFFDRAIAISPHRLSARLERASLAFSERADVQPLRKELSALLIEQPENAKDFAEDLFQSAIMDRDPSAVNRALAFIPAEGLSARSIFYPREWFAGFAALVFNDTVAAHASFTSARAVAEKLTRDQPENGPAWSLLGQVDAALGRKEEAVREGRRGCELVPMSKDALTYADLVTSLAIIYAWTGDKDLAFEQLTISAQTPAGVTYGELRLHPAWDVLRGDPRFEKIVASLAPK